MRVGLLFGGNSFEHDVSIVTAKIVYKELKKNHDVLLLYVDYNNDVYRISKLYQSDIKVGSKKIHFTKKGIKKGLLKLKLDVLISVMHGNNGEDGLAYWLSNFYQIPYVGSNGIASGLLMDKYYTYAVLKEHGYQVLPSKLLLNKDFELNNLDYPFIVKPVEAGSSIGIDVVNNEEELVEKINYAFKFSDRLLIQKYLQNFSELNQAAYIQNGEIIVSKIEEVYKHEAILSFNDKYLQSKLPKKRVFVEDEKIVTLVSSVTKALYQLFDLSGVVRFDYMLEGETLYVNEVNTTPGSLAYYLFDVSPTLFFDNLIYEALRRKTVEKANYFESEILNHTSGLKNY